MGTPPATRADLILIIVKGMHGSAWRFVRGGVGPPGPPTGGVGEGGALGCGRLEALGSSPHLPAGSRLF